MAADDFLGHALSFPNSAEGSALCTAQTVDYQEGSLLPWDAQAFESAMAYGAAVASPENLQLGLRDLTSSWPQTRQGERLHGGGFYDPSSMEEMRWHRQEYGQMPEPLSGDAVASTTTDASEVVGDVHMGTQSWEVCSQELELHAAAATMTRVAGGQLSCGGDHLWYQRTLGGDVAKVCDSSMNEAWMHHPVHQQWITSGNEAPMLLHFDASSPFIAPPPSTEARNEVVPPASQSGAETTFAGNPSGGAEDTMLTMDIASAVADFLSGNMEDGEDDPNESVEEDTAHEAPAEDPLGAGRINTQSKVSSAMLTESLNFQRGLDLAQSLLSLPLPPDMQEAQFARVLTDCIMDLVRQGQRATVEVVQQRLRDQKIDEVMVQALLVFCARNAASFELSVARDGQVCVLLPSLPAQRATEMHIVQSKGRLFDGDYSAEFLEVFVDKVNEKLFKSPMAGNQAGTPAQATPIAYSACGPIAASTACMSPNCFDGGTAVSKLLDSPSSQKIVCSQHGKKHASTGTPFAAATSATSTIVATGRQLRERASKVDHEGHGSSSSNAGVSASTLAATLQAAGVETLMVRNVPNSVTQKRLIEELASSGFSGLFDFCYMPSMFGTGVGKGYAFINFISSEAVGKFVSVWHGSRRFGITASEAALNVSAAALQGREQNAKKWDAPRMRRVRNPALRPLVIDLPGRSKSTEIVSEADGPEHALFRTAANIDSRK